MNDEEKCKLEALGCLIDMTDSSDWHLFHNSVIEDVAKGILSKAFEKAYREMVDKKADEEEA